MALIAVPLVLLAFATLRRRTTAFEHPPGEDDAARARTEQEFAEAEAYEAQWREEHQDDPRARLP